MPIKKLILILIVLSLPLSACLVGAVPTALPAQTRTPLPQQKPADLPTAALADHPPAAAPTLSSSIPAGGLSPWMVPLPAFNQAPVTAWTPAAPYPAQADNLPLNASKISNAPVIAGLTPEQKSFLEKNGFVVIQNQETQFTQIRQNVSTRYGQPYFLTTDAAYHALHLSFDELLKAVERQSLRPDM